MTQDIPSSCTAFAGERRIASGSLMHVALASKTVADHDSTVSVLVFDDATSRLVELDLRGSLDDVRERVLALRPDDHPEPRRGRGRPKLGVVSKEVTLLPRHWAWLAAQRGGASATLRRLVEQARRELGGTDRVRSAQDSAYRFMTAMVGDEPGFEEAIRALFAADRDRFVTESEGWPSDLKSHARMLAQLAFSGESPPEST